jgi:hypothetical protein
MHPLDLFGFVAATVLIALLGYLNYCAWRRPR